MSPQRVYFLGSQVVEDFDNYCGQCCAQTCACTYTQKVMLGNSRQSLVHKYSLVNSYCCFGRVNNCCGGTCCKPNFFIDVVSPEGKFINAVQMTYGAGGAEDCCRMGAAMNNYVMSFPQGSNHWERLMLLTGVLSMEYAYHSRKVRAGGPAGCVSGGRAGAGVMCTQGRRARSG